MISAHHITASVIRDAVKNHAKSQMSGFKYPKKSQNSNNVTDSQRSSASVSSTGSPRMLQQQVSENPKKPSALMDMIISSKKSDKTSSNKMSEPFVMDLDSMLIGKLFYIVINGFRT